MQVNNTNTTINKSSMQNLQKNAKSDKNAKLQELEAMRKLGLQGIKDKKRGEFLDKLDRIKSESVKDELESIFEKITAQSDKIGDKVYLKDILEYKKLVKEFLNVATNNSHKFSNENFLDRRGRYRSYSIVKTVDRELENLTKDFINGQIDHMGILQKMDDIRGMLLDIMM